VEDKTIIRRRNDDDNNEEEEEKDVIPQVEGGGRRLKQETRTMKLEDSTTARDTSIKQTVKR